MTPKNKNMLSELMRMGYDFNVMLSVAMDLATDISMQLHDLAKEFIDEFYGQFAERYTASHMKETCCRFAMTLGIGLAWKKNELGDGFNAGEAYEQLKAPRALFEMDEYIEDSVGMWFDSESLQHYLFLRLFDRCYELVGSRYGLDSPQERYDAAEVMMTFGYCYEITRLIRAKAVVPYKGAMPWHWEVWNILYRPSDSDTLDEYNHWCKKTYAEGDFFAAGHTHKKAEGQDYVVDDVYREYTLNQDAGMKVIVQDRKEKSAFISAYPVFETKRTFLMTLDKVQVWENGAEATLTVHSVEDEAFELTFYDTDYLKNKDRYIIDEAYLFDIYGIAYDVAVVPEDERSFTLEGESAVKFNERLGYETEYDDDGKPMPVHFSTRELHSLTQTNDEFPEDASFRAPVDAVHANIGFLDKKVHEIEITSPYRDPESDKEHKISIFVAAEAINSESLEVGTPVQGVVHLQGKMTHAVNLRERPSMALHSFDAIESDGSRSVFCHDCDPQDAGQPMSPEECGHFAKEVFHRHFSSNLHLLAFSNDDHDGHPDFQATRNRYFWVRPDVNYDASALFVNEDVTMALFRHYATGRLCVMAYITLYDEDGNQCRWLKGRNYTARFHYGSMTPEIKMEIMPLYSHEKLVEILYGSFKNLSTLYLSRFLHKDLDFRSPALKDPIITSKEYVARTNVIIQNNRKAADGPVTPSIEHDDNGEAYIVLSYPKGAVDEVRIKSASGYITEILVTGKKGNDIAE